MGYTRLERQKKQSMKLIYQTINCFLILRTVAAISPTAVNSYEEVKIGVIGDLKSSTGMMVESCIAMAHSDFYNSHPNYRTRLAFHTKNSGGHVFGAASGALELLKNEEVVAILGPSTTPEAKFVSELGAKAQVPIVSFSATSSSLSSQNNPYFIQMAAPDSAQLKAMAAILQGFGWQEIVIVYEDTGYEDGFIPNLSNAIRETGIHISFITALPTYANDSYILDQLHKLKAMPTRVFLVHMTSLLGSMIFLHANTAGMMSKGYAWLITDGLSSVLGSMGSKTINTMQGVLGIRPYVSESERLTAFREKWEREFKCTKPEAELNMFGLWVYDAVWALAIAVERIGRPINSGFVKLRKHPNAIDMATLGSSKVGPVLLKEIANTRFKGLTGDFKLVNGQLQISAIEILHVIGKGERPIGYWTPDRGLSREPDSTDISSHYSTSVNVLRNIIWPGDSTVKPMDAVVPMLGTRLRVGVPVKEGFTEFVKLEQFQNTTEYNMTGFCADIFQEILHHLPFEIENPQYIPFRDPETGKSAGSYNDLLKQLTEKKYDIVVADVTILAERAQEVEFSIPYLESEVVMLRQIKYDRGKDIWIFLKPFRCDLWLTIASLCIFTGLIILILERRVEASEELGTLVSLPLTSLAFPERNMVASKWSVLVMVMWLFTGAILLQSYTANLSSMLTVSRLQHPTNKLYCIGYQEGSFVRELLTKRLNFNESRIKSYASVEQYHDALAKGCVNGGVDAIFDELPFLKVFLDTYGNNNYKLEGSSYKTGGLGFAFPKGSTLTPHISMALLNLTGGGEMHAIIGKSFGPDYSDRDYFFEISSSNGGIGTQSLAGLFFINGTFAILALLFTSSWFRRGISSLSGYYNRLVHPSPSPDDGIERSVHFTVETRSVNGDLSPIVIHDNSVVIPTHIDSDSAIDQGDVRSNPT